MSAVHDPSTPTPPSEDQAPASRSEASGPTAYESRAARRTALRAGQERPRAASRRPLVVLAVIGLSTLVLLAGYAHPVLLAAAVALTGIVMASGWPDLLGAPVPRIPRLLLALVALAGPVVVATTGADPYLRRVPLVVAVGLLLVVFHQLFRRDGRPRLTEAISISAAGIAVLACGVAFVPLARILGGSDVVACTGAALAASALADLLVGRRGVHAWLLPLAMLLGGWASAGAAVLAGSPRVGQAVLLGFLIGAVSHALRRVFAVLPSMGSGSSQLASAASSVLVCGVVAFVFARLILGA